MNPSHANADASRPRPPRASAARRACRREDGQAVVEFALIVPVVIFLLLLIAYAAFALNNVNDEGNIAQIGARLAETNSTCIEKGSSHTCPIGVREEAPFLHWLTEKGDNKQVREAKATICSPTSKLHDYVEVKLSYKYKWLPIFKLGAESPITSTARMTIEQEPYVAYPTTC
jgi:TadE-like protein